MTDCSVRTCISYYDFLTFEIQADSEADFKIFHRLYEDHLFPFLRKFDLFECPTDFRIRISRRTEEVDVTGWSEMVFFNALQDNPIADFSTGYQRRHSAASRHVFNDKSGTLFSVDENKIHLAYTNERSLARDLQRVLKQLIVSSVENAGGAVLHASAFSLNGEATCFLGEKGQGKTTSLLEALNIKGAKYLTNDRLLVLPSGDGFDALGWFEELRLVQPGNKEKSVVKVLDMFAADRIETSRLRLTGVVLPDCNDAYTNATAASEVICGQLLSPVDPQRPKWLGFAAPKKFDIEKFHLGVPTTVMKWVYSERASLPQKIKETLSHV